MNTLSDPVMLDMPDVQSGPDTRRIPIQRVGVRGVRHPLLVAGADGHPQASIADWELTVALPATEKGTHMSRFIALLEEYRQQPLTPAVFQRLASAMLPRLQAESGRIVARFPFFMEKEAPVSGVRSLMDYQVTWEAEADRAGGVRFSQQVLVPVTSLCPCSKAIAEYGAHNQRSHVTVRLWCESGQEPELGSLIQRIEAQSSCELWGLLKRVDEKFVTERAYENPKFVEDLVRDVAAMLQSWPGVQRFQVEAENFESIHNHSAYACVQSA